MLIRLILPLFFTVFRESFGIDYVFFRNWPTVYIYDCSQRVFIVAEHAFLFHDNARSRCYSNDAIIQMTQVSCVQHRYNTIDYHNHHLTLQTRLQIQPDSGFYPMQDILPTAQLHAEDVISYKWTHLSRERLLLAILTWGCFDFIWLYSLLEIGRTSLWVLSSFCPQRSRHLTRISYIGTFRCTHLFVFDFILY